MATKAAAFHQFMSSFGMPAYAAGSVPGDAKTPYVTYDFAEGAWGQGDVSIAASIWHRTESEAALNAKVSEIGKRLGLSGVLLPCDGGGMWVKRGAPWAQSSVDSDPAVKRRRLLFDVEFMTTF